MSEVVKNRLSDLMPNPVVKCLFCRKVKTTEGSQKFHSHHVCADCIKTLGEKK